MLYDGNSVLLAVVESSSVFCRQETKALSDLLMMTQKVHSSCSAGSHELSSKDSWIPSWYSMAQQGTYMMLEVVLCLFWISPSISLTVL